MTEENLPKKWSEQFFSVTKSLLEFTDREIHPIVQSVIALQPTEREHCFLTIYHRAYLDMKTLSRLQPSDFQTVARISRAMLEYAIDLRLIDAIPNSVAKIATFIDLEKLKTAQQVVLFKKAYPDAKVTMGAYAEFITNWEGAINAKKAALWPGIKRIDHWSLLNTEARCKKLGRQFEQWYQVEFRKTSWHVHSGLTGFVNVSAEIFTLYGAGALALISQTYCEVLSCAIDELKISSAVTGIKRLMKFAQLAPFAENEEQAQQLLQELMG